MPDTMLRMINHSHTNSNASSEASTLCPVIDRLRAAGSDWNKLHYRRRLSILGKLAASIAERGEHLARSVFRPAATWDEVLASEVLPLAEACRYVSQVGASLLAPRKLTQRDRAWWMGSVQVAELREALGLVLIIGPSNYPLFLPGVQLIQALAAGNAVLVKPAPGCEAAIEELVKLCSEVGVPRDVVGLLDTDPATAEHAIEAGVDKVIFTGSLTTGRKVGELCSRAMTPVAMELSGNDAVLVTDDADLQQVAKCLAYALSLNGGQTCIAPRRVFATSNTLERLIPLLKASLASSPARKISLRGSNYAAALVEQAVNDGASFICGDLDSLQDADHARPVVLSNVRSDMAVTQEDIFAPVLSLIAVQDMQDAIEQSAKSPYTLGASVFGQMPAAWELANRVCAGCVTINDILVPTADPRVSFGGRGASGYGITRGLHGLREMTQLKVVCTRSGRWMPHLTTSPKMLGPTLLGILQLRHGRNWSARWQGLKTLMKAGKRND